MVKKKIKSRNQIFFLRPKKRLERTILWQRKKLHEVSGWTKTSKSTRRKQMKKRVLFLKRNQIMEMKERRKKNRIRRERKNQMIDGKCI